MVTKNHYLNFQVGPIMVPKSERAHYRGLLISLINGIVENTHNENEAKNFISFFLQERLTSRDKQVLKRLKLFVEPTVNKLISTSNDGELHSFQFDRIKSLLEEK